MILHVSLDQKNLPTRERSQVPEHGRARVIFFGGAKIIKMCKASIRKYMVKSSSYTSIIMLRTFYCVHPVHLIFIIFTLKKMTKKPKRNHHQLITKKSLSIQLKYYFSGGQL
jgi:hypothetical protein